MPLMTTKPMFDLAYSGGFGIGAFNVNNMELAQGIVDACAASTTDLVTLMFSSYGWCDPSIITLVKPSLRHVLTRSSVSP